MMWLAPRTWVRPAESSPSPGWSSVPSSTDTWRDQSPGSRARHSDAATSRANRSAAPLPPRGRIRRYTRSSASSSRRRSSSSRTTLPRKPVPPVRKTARSVIPRHRLGGGDLAAPDPSERLVAEAEHVARAHGPLHLAGPLQRGGRKPPRQEAAPQLAHAVVVRERAPRAQDLVPRRALQLGVRFGGVLHALVVEAEIEVHADPGLVDLRHPAGDERPARQSAGRVLEIEPPLDPLAERQRLAPGDRGLERLAQDVVLHHEVADVGDAEGELVAPPPVFRAGAQAAVPPRDAADRRLLLRRLAPGALVEQRAGHHPLRLEPLEPGHDELLRLPGQRLEPSGPGLE